MTPRFKAKRRSGSVLVILAASLALLFGTAASVVDLASALQSRTHQQMADDAAALAAAQALGGSGGRPAARLAALDFASRNGLTLAASDVVFSTAADGSTLVTVGSTQAVPTAFARALGVPFVNVGASAIATVRTVSELPAASLPLALPAYRDPDGTYHVLSTPNGPYVTPRLGDPTTFQLQAAGSCHHPCSCVPLACGAGTCDDFTHGVCHGCGHAASFGCTAHACCAVEPESCGQSMRDRVAACSANADVCMPLVARADFERDGCQGGGQVIGCLGLHVTRVTDDGTIEACYQPVVVNAHATSSGGASSGCSVGVQAPSLCDAHGRCAP